MNAKILVPLWFVGLVACGSPVPPSPYATASAASECAPNSNRPSNVTYKGTADGRALSAVITADDETSASLYIDQSTRVDMIRVGRIMCGSGSIYADTGARADAHIIAVLINDVDGAAIRVDKFDLKHAVRVHVEGVLHAILSTNDSSTTGYFLSPIGDSSDIEVAVSATDSQVVDLAVRRRLVVEISGRFVTVAGPAGDERTVLFAHQVEPVPD